MDNYLWLPQSSRMAYYLGLIDETRTAINYKLEFWIKAIEFEGFKLTNSKLNIQSANLVIEDRD